MQIHGTNQAHQAQGLQGPHFNRAPQKAEGSASPSQVTDQLDISPAALEASQADAGQEIRSDLVARLRSEIANGTYETPDKLDSALDRLLDTIG